MRRQKKEADPVYCPFYMKISSCMHGESCARIHVKPKSARCIVIKNLYPNPQHFMKFIPDDVKSMIEIDEEEAISSFSRDVYRELNKFGEISDFMVAKNLKDHLLGNVYVLYERECDAVKALHNIRQRCYAGRPIDAEFSSITRLSDAICKQYLDGACSYGNDCNFVHPYKHARC